MKNIPNKTLLAAALCTGMAAFPALVGAEDIDIFTGASAGSGGNPRILIVLDNTSNWARHSQKWPGGIQQGQSEANAIKTVLGSLSSNVNLGLFEFVTGGNANDDGGMISYAIRPMDATNKANFSTRLTTIYNNITDPDEKKNQGTPYGNLMYDVYNYFSGSNSYSPSATIASKADGDGYTSAYTKFAAPLTAADTCGKNFVIFIGNPSASGPTSDSAANTAALAALGGVTTQLSLPNYTSQAVNNATNVGVTSACYASKAAAEAVYYPGSSHEFSAACDAYSEQCSVGNATNPAGPIACPTGSLSYSVVQATYHPAVTTYPQTLGTPVVTTANTTGAYASAAAASAANDHGSLSCPATTVVGAVTTAYSCSYAVGAAVPDPGATITSGPTTNYYASAGAVNANTDHGSLSCPTGYSCSYSVGAAVGTASPVVTTAGTTSFYATAGEVNTATDKGGLSCPANNTCTYSVGAQYGVATSLGTAVVTTANSNSSYASSAAATTAMNNGSDRGGLTCPAGNTCTYSLGAAVTSNSVTSATTSSCYRALTGGTGSTYWDQSGDTASLSCQSGYTCSYSGAFGTAAGCSGSGSNVMKVLVTQTAVPNTTKYVISQSARPITYQWTVSQSATANLKYTVSQSATLTGQKFSVSQTATPTITTTTVTPAYTSNVTLGMTSQCYASAPASTTDFASQCTGTNISCTYNNTPTASTLAACPSGTSAYQIVGTDTTYTNVATSTSTPDNNPFNADEWARFMHDKGIPVAGSSIKPNVVTYTIDVYNAQPNAQHTSLLLSMAKAGGGKYFTAKSEQEIVDALKQIMVEIQAVNSTFASTSLPVNATNRSQNENQVFIGMFRPDPDAKPRWFGNIKRYQLVSSGAGVELGDVNGKLAVNSVTGFVTPCATSYWTTDSGSYWNGLGINPDPAGTCDTTTYNAYSDSPDGPQVEKGAAAQKLRQLDIATRNMKTLSSNALAAFNTTTAPSLSSDLVKFIRGEDVNNEKGTGDLAAGRPSIHGDVIHSRPLPVNYGGSTGVTVYYGANDGAFHAVNANTGAERWSFVAPEFFSRLSRLKDNSPLVSYPSLAAGIVPSPTPKDYFFDGSTGLYQNADNTKIWIFPTMRRGGRMIYALDVTSVDSPSHKWAIGCPNLSDDTGCSADMTGIGQTWSVPSVAFIKGYSTTKPVVIFGGGYDSCEDSDVVEPSCGSTKGKYIYIVDATDGTLIRSFETTRGVAGDVTLIDIDNDGYPDYAYAADIGGNIYRIDFITTPTAKVPLAAASWTSHRVAYTNGAHRKFLFAPAVLGVGAKAYLAIGSGDREHPLQQNYPYNGVLYNRFYVYKDDLASTSGTAAINLDSTASPNNMADYSSGTTCASPQALPSSSLNGWFMDLAKGEQTVTSALIVAGMVTFSTNQPVAAAAGTCASPLGVARGYWVNLLNGAGAVGVDGVCDGERSSTFVGGGMPPSPVMATSVPVGGRAVSAVIGAVQKFGGGSPIDAQKPPLPLSSKRRKAYTYTTGD